MQTEYATSSRQSAKSLMIRSEYRALEKTTELIDELRSKNTSTVRGKHEAEQIEIELRRQDAKIETARRMQEIA